MKHLSAIVIKSFKLGENEELRYIMSKVNSGIRIKRRGGVYKCYIQLFIQELQANVLFKKLIFLLLFFSPVQFFFYEWKIVEIQHILDVSLFFLMINDSGKIHFIDKFVELLKKKIVIIHGSMINKIFLRIRNRKA